MLVLKIVVTLLVPLLHLFLLVFPGYFGSTVAPVHICVHSSGAIVPVLQFPGVLHAVFPDSLGFSVHILLLVSIEIDFTADIH